MPIYCYKCNDCEESFEIKHSMSFNEQLCINCNSSNIFRVPALLAKSPGSNHTKHTTGMVVDKYIKDAKEEIKKDKKSLSSRSL